MILNAPHLLETALLMLAAFLAGATIGLLVRMLVAKPKPAVATAAPAVEAQPPAPAVPQLVTAPEIAPLPAAPRPNAAERLAAAARGSTPAEPPMPAEPVEPAMPAVKMPELTLPSMPAFSGPIEPTHVAGETVAGRHIDNPEHPQAASIEDVRAELEAQIDAAPAEAIAPVPEVAPTPATDTAVVPAAMAIPEPAPASLQEGLAAEAEMPMLAEVTDEEAETPLPVEERTEPEIEAAPVVLTDAPAEIAAELQDVVETPDEDSVPDVVPEAPLVEPAYEKEEDEANGDTEPPPPPPARTPSVDDELAAMRAIEGGWSPRPTATRRPAELPEGVSAAEVAAAEQAVAESGAAVASATAMATAVLEEIAPARAPRPAGGFGRPPALPAPREGGKDDLGRIKGLAPAIASSLNGLGIYHYDQIADWDQKAVVWLESHFGFKGRIARERWQEQARDLARGRGAAARLRR
jgi:predicted flap endonuclease-1-like 5' DNA nuclease